MQAPKRRARKGDNQAPDVAPKGWPVLERKHAQGVSEVFPTRFCHRRKRNGGSDEMPQRCADGVKYAPRFIFFIDFRNLSITSFGRKAHNAFEKNNGSKCIYIYVCMHIHGGHVLSQNISAWVIEGSTGSFHRSHAAHDLGMDRAHRAIHEKLLIKECKWPNCTFCFIYSIELLVYFL